MKYQNLFSGKNKKDISICRLLKILLEVLSVKIDILPCFHLNSIKLSKTYPVHNKIKMLNFMMIYSLC